MHKAAVGSRHREDMFFVEQELKQLNNRKSHAGLPGESGNPAYGEAMVPVMRYRTRKTSPVDDVVAVEEPLEIFIDGKPHYLTMRLPGEEVCLALGYCFSEGIIDSIRDVLLVKYCAEETGNRVDITIDHERRPASQRKERKLPAYSSCGICGKELMEDICLRLDRRESSLGLPVDHIDEMLTMLKARQPVFSHTGATHAACIMNEKCEPLALSEDIGRHNALDKTIGRLVLEGRPAAAQIIVVTSRISFEMVQKAARTGAEIMIGMSAATSLAIELAKSVNLTLVGFARNGLGNIYSAAERILCGNGARSKEPEKRLDAGAGVKGDNP